MKVAANIFWIIGLFFIAAATLYGFWVEWTEWAGIPAIYAVGGMSWMIAWYLRAAEHKYGVGPADDEDGQIVEYAGTYGTFAPWSWWPLGLGLGCAIIVTGLAVEPGTAVTLAQRGRIFTGRVVPMPFVPHRYHRKGALR